MDAFVPAYFQALARHIKDLIQPDVMLPALMSGTQLMLENRDPSHTLQEVFEADFYPKLGISKEALSGAIEDFYDNVFPTLRSVTRPRQGARELVEWALAKGYLVAIATNPLFPRKAILHRLRWAGLDPEQFALISSFETFHFTKPHPAYFAEVLGRLGWPDGPVLMVGNDLDLDLAPAQKLRLATYHIDNIETSGDRPETDRRGNLVGLRSWLESTDLTSLEPSFQTPEAILAIMASIPAVLQSLSSGLDSNAWSHEPTAQDWAMIELVCHLRDTEREVHQMQIKTLLEQVQPFVPRPDAAVWAKQRKYLNEDGPAAVRDCTSERRETWDMLKGLDESNWARAARHAIFGPTNFKEVVGFMADHDRMHIQQAWNTLRTL